MNTKACDQDPHGIGCEADITLKAAIAEAKRVGYLNSREEMRQELMADNHFELLNKLIDLGYL